MHHCLNCRTELEVSRARCPACGLAYEGRFSLPRLARLAPAHQHLAEQIILVGGNLKEAAALMDMSYPSLRKRLDRLIEALGELRAKDEALSRAFLDDVEAGRMTPEEAARLIKERTGGN